MTTPINSRNQDEIGLEDILLLSYENDYYFNSRLKEFLATKHCEATILDFAESTAFRYSHFRKKEDYLSIKSPLLLAYDRLKSPNKFHCQAQNYLTYFENTYLIDKTVNQLLMTSPFYQSSHHYRFPYYNRGTLEERNILAWTLLEWSEQYLKNTSAKVIFSTNSNYLLKQVFFR